MKVFLCVLAFLVAGGYALVGNTCQDETQCDEGECCQILSENMVMSKRQIASILPLDSENKTGSCQLYKLEGDYCSFFETLNGYCGCGPGLFCNSYERPLDTTEIPLLFPVTTGAPVPLEPFKPRKPYYEPRGRGNGFGKHRGWGRGRHGRSMVAPQPGYEWVHECAISE